MRWSACAYTICKWVSIELMCTLYLHYKYGIGNEKYVEEVVFFFILLLLFLLIIHSTDVQLCYMHFCFVLFFYLDMIKCCMWWAKATKKRNNEKNKHRFASNNYGRRKTKKYSCEVRLMVRWYKHNAHCYCACALIQFILNNGCWKYFFLMRINFIRYFFNYRFYITYSYVFSLSKIFCIFSRCVTISDFS